MKWLVLYSSITGNTKLIAEAIANAANADIFPIKDAPKDLSRYDVVALGYWLRLGRPDDAMQAFLPTINNKEVVLFQTHGADFNSEHAITSLARAAYLLGENVSILGTFSSQGKINPKMIEARMKNTDANDPHQGKEAIERWKRAENHPNEEDLERARVFVQKMREKYEMRKKYMEKNRK